MGLLADIIFEDYGVTLTYREHKFKLNVYEIKTTLFDIHNIKFVIKMLYMIPSTAPHRGAIFIFAEYSNTTVYRENLAHRLACYLSDRSLHAS